MSETRSFAKAELKVEAKVWDRQPMVLHEEVATGEHEKHGKFRIIREISAGTHYIVFDGQCYEISMRDLMNAVIDSKEGK